MADKFTGYMDGTDFETERAQPPTGNTIYSSPEDVLKDRKCAQECGVVEVEVTLVRWVREPMRGPGITPEQFEENRAKRRAELEAEIAAIIKEARDNTTGSPSSFVDRLADFVEKRR